MAVVYLAVPVIPLFLTIGMCRPSSSRKRLARPKSTMKILSCCPLGPKTKLLGLISLDVKWRNENARQRKAMTESHPCTSLTTQIIEILLPTIYSGGQSIWARATRSIGHKCSLESVSISWDSKQGGYEGMFGGDSRGPSKDRNDPKSSQISPDCQFC